MMNNNEFTNTNNTNEVVTDIQMTRNNTKEKLKKLGTKLLKFSLSGAAVVAGVTACYYGMQSIEEGVELIFDTLQEEDKES